MFSTGLYSDVLDAPAFVYLNVLPCRDRTVAIFSFLADQLAEVETTFGRIWSASGEAQEYLLSKLVLRHCENLVIAPALFDTFSAVQKETIRRYFSETIWDHQFDMADPRLSLFRSVC